SRPSARATTPRSTNGSTPTSASDNANDGTLGDPGDQTATTEVRSAGGRPPQRGASPANQRLAVRAGERGAENDDCRRSGPASRDEALRAGRASCEAPVRAVPA